MHFFEENISKLEWNRVIKVEEVNVVDEIGAFIDIFCVLIGVNESVIEHVLIMSVDVHGFQLELD